MSDSNSEGTTVWLELPSPIFLFWYRFLAGTARWQCRLRAGGTAGFCFVRPLTATLRTCEKIDPPCHSQRSEESAFVCFQRDKADASLRSEVVTFSDGFTGGAYIVLYVCAPTR
jgi:hypothetical protein